MEEPWGRRQLDLPGNCR